MERKRVFLHVIYNACIEQDEHCSNHSYYTEYERVFFEDPNEENDITELLWQHRYLQDAIYEELSFEYPKTGNNLHANLCLYLPVKIVEEMEKQVIFNTLSMLDNGQLDSGMDIIDN